MEGVYWEVIIFLSVSYENRSLNYLKRHPSLHNTMPRGLGTEPVVYTLQTTAVATCLFKGSY